MKILIVSQYFWPETFRINEVAESLREAGCEVSVLTGQPNYPDGKVFPGFRAWSTGGAERNGIRIHRVPLAPRGRSGALRLVANYLSFIVSASLLGPWLLRGQRFDAVFVYGVSPILQVIPALAVRRFTGGALVTWVQDLWPQSLEVTGFVRNPRVLAIVDSVVRWLYRHNDLLLVQSRGFVPLVAAMSECTPVEYHPNPGELAFSEEPTTVPPALTLAPGFNLVFAGNMGTVQALDTILEAAHLLRDEPSINFVLVGSGSRDEWLRSELQRLRLVNVQLPGRFSPAAMPAILAQASALLVSLVRDPVLSQTIPSKVQAYLASGRPIIASLDGEGARVVQEAGAGVTCPAGDSAALADAIRSLQRRPMHEREQMGVAGRAYYSDHFEPRLLAERLAQRLAVLNAGRNGGDKKQTPVMGSDHG